MLPIPQRQGIKTREIYYREDAGAMGQDPASPVGYILPLAEEAQFGTDQKLIQAPVYKGNRKPDGVISGMITAEGENPYGMECRTFPRILKDFFGPDGYVRPGGGTTKLHRYFIPTDDDAEMGSCQIQDESLETPVQYVRNKGVRPSPINLSYANEGVARYGLGLMGMGSEVYTDLGGTKNDEGYRAMSYFNGTAKLNGYFLVGMNEFSMSLNGNLSRADAAFRGGVAAAINYGKINVTGRIQLMFSTAGSAPENNLNFYNYAVNESVIPLECMWSDGPLTTTDAWIRIILSATRFSRKSFRAGGAAGKFIGQDFQLVDDASGDIAAEKFSVNKGPYTLTTNNKIGIKLNGGATIPITLGTASTTITLTAAVAAINANVTFAAAATAEEFNGRILLRTNGKGSTYSIQIDTAQTDSAHTILGFDGIAFTGYTDTPLLIEVFNDIGADL